jgi:hypothetical protein
MYRIAAEHESWSTRPGANGDVWRRVSIGPGIEIHVSAEAEKGSVELIEELIDRSRKFVQQEGRRRKI